MSWKSTKALPIWAIKLKRFRMSKGLTQKEVADILGLSLMSIAAYEQGIRKPKNETVELMKEKLGLDVYYVFFDETLEEFECKK